jgi:hypothetical protein
MIPGFVIYLALAALVGYIGKDRKFGFWGNFFAAVVFTPLVGLVIAFASNKRLLVVE